MRIAFVTPWFGAELQGGAERLALEVAQKLQARGHDLEILTTCSESFHADWYRNTYRPGLSEEAGLQVRRFRVDRADRQRFAAVNQRLIETWRSRLKPGVPPIEERAARDFVQHNINSFDMAVHMRNQASKYDAFVFLPYLYGTTLQGWRYVPQKAVLQPCLHDEAYAYLPRVTEMMFGVARILFNSKMMFDAARRLYGPAIIPNSNVVGIAISLAKPAGTAPINGFMPESSKYVLYLGRRSQQKNVDLLERAYRRFREIAPDSDLRLVLAGPDTPGRIEAPPEGVIDLGFVTEDQKVRLLEHCAVLAQPSINESFSRAMFEAWTTGRPVLVHDMCAATAGAVTLTGAGWTADDEQSWQAALLRIDGREPAELDAIGARAKDFVRTYASWDGVLDRYEETFRSLISDRKHSEWQPSRRVSALHQFVPRMSYGSANAVQAIALRDELREHKIASSIFSPEADAEYEAEVDGPKAPQKARVLTYGNGSRLFAPKGKVALTPVIDPRRWATAPDATLMSALQDGRTNLLFVGEVCEENAQVELVQTFGHYLALDFESRLILAGRTSDESYHRRLRDAIEKIGLAQRVLVPGTVSEPSLQAFYRTASVYCSLANGTAIGLPLIEAMWFDIPVCALRTAASEALCDNAGILIDDATDRLRLAGLWRVLASDPAERERVLQSQRIRRTDFEPRGWCRRVATFVDALEG